MTNKKKSITIPKWLQALSNATLKAAIAENPAVTTASGWTIKDGEARQDATEDLGVQQLQNNLAVLGGTALGITAAPAAGVVLSNPLTQKVIGQTAASMLGGTAIDETSKVITGQPFGRAAASAIGRQNAYDRSALARFGYDALNPGYWGGNLVIKGTNAAINAAEKTIKTADNILTIGGAFGAGKLKFGKPTTYNGIHQSYTPITQAQFPFQRWDVVNHGADPNGFWITLADKPNTTGTMGSRPFASRWTVTVQKPLIQTGEVRSLLGKKNNTRNAIVKFGRKNGADAFEFRGIKDNALPQTDVVMLTERTNPIYKGNISQVEHTPEKMSLSEIEAAWQRAIETGDIPMAQRMRDLHFIKASDSKVTTPQWHSTDGKFWEFDINRKPEWGPSDAYIHVGTEQAAKDIGGKRMLKLYVKQQNPLMTYDGIQNKRTDIINEIAKSKNLSSSEVQNLQNEWRQMLNNTHYDDRIQVQDKKVQELLKRYGFDGIEYVNKVEDKGSISRGLIDPKQLKLADYVTYDDNNKVIPLSKRDDFTNPDIRYGLIPFIGGLGILNSQSNDTIHSNNK